MAHRLRDLAGAAFVGERQGGLQAIGGVAVGVRVWRRCIAMPTAQSVSIGYTGVMPGIPSVRNV